MVFVPARELLPHAEYVLYLLEADRPYQGSRGETFAWTTLRGADSTAPRWRSAPKVRPGVFGCRLRRAVYVPVSLLRRRGDACSSSRSQPMAARDAAAARESRYLLARAARSYRTRDVRWAIQLESGRRYTVKLTLWSRGNRRQRPAVR